MAERSAAWTPWFDWKMTVGRLAMLEVPLLICWEGKADRLAAVRFARSAAMP